MYWLTRYTNKECAVTLHNIVTFYTTIVTYISSSEINIVPTSVSLLVMQGWLSRMQQMHTPCLYTFSASTFIQPVHSFSQYIHSASSTFLKELFLNDLFLPFCYDLGYLLPSVCLLLIGGHVHICNNMASSIMKTLDLDYIFAQKETQKDHPQRIS